MSTGSWLVGSIEGFDSQSVDLNSGTSVTSVFSYTGTYIDHGTTGLSMIKTFKAALLAASLTGADVYIGQDGYVRISASGTFAIDWTDTGMRDALGFDTNLSGASSYTAANRSPYLWIPRRNDSPGKAPLGVIGNSMHDRVIVQSRDGTQVTRQFGDPVRTNDFTWHYIDKAQYWDGETAGELFKFHSSVLAPGAKFWIYRLTEADSTSASAVTLGTSALGPYAYADQANSLKLTRSSGFERTDCKFDWTCEVLKTPEYTT